MTTEAQPSKRERRNAKREARYKAGKRAEAEVMRRLALAVDRISVNAQSNHGGIPAQFLHAVHYIQRGWTGSFSPENDSRSVPRDAPAFAMSTHEAEEMTLLLHRMCELAANAKYTVDEADR